MEKINNIQKNAEFKQLVKFATLKAAKNIKSEKLKKGREIYFEKRQNLASDIIMNSSIFATKFVEVLCVDDDLFNLFSIDFIKEKTKVLRLLRGSHQEVEIDIDVPKLKYTGKKTIKDDIYSLVFNNFDLIAGISEQEK